MQAVSDMSVAGSLSGEMTQLWLCISSSYSETWLLRPSVGGKNKVYKVVYQRWSYWWRGGKFHCTMRTQSIFCQHKLLSIKRLCIIIVRLSLLYWVGVNVRPFTSLREHTSWTVLLFYYDFVSGCDCDPSGSLGELCDPTDGSCMCVDNVGGQTCSSCAADFWGFDGEEGCTSCDCDPIGEEIAIAAMKTRLGEAYTRTVHVQSLGSGHIQWNLY